jgi:RHH-type proline utilization regulon transcriptional repressor/proline dehydrogenase/delta 1-pyrroline-5-carboxylate dehydrogenase
MGSSHPPAGPDATHKLAGARAGIAQAHRTEETAALQPLLALARLPSAEATKVQQRALRLAQAARTRLRLQGGVDAFMVEYDLSSEEGILLMCLAESLLRIPDTQTAQRLIRDRLSRGQWDEHLGRSPSLLVNASTWGLLLTGRLVGMAPELATNPAAALQRLVARSGERVVSLALKQAMALLAEQFVLGRDMAEALTRRSRYPAGVRFSFDRLGEAAQTQADAEGYFEAYSDAIAHLAAEAGLQGDPLANPGVSIKLSALHPRYGPNQRQRVAGELFPRLETLLVEARRHNLPVTLDAEEAERLDLSLDLFAQALELPALRGWNGLGLAVQSYQKRAYPVLVWLQALAERLRLRLPVRLVKGAYWDTEIKRAQEHGLDGYPVFSRKPATDVSFLACARWILRHPRHFYGQFATHNAHTLAYLLQTGAGLEFEFQRLHGMGDALYAALEEESDRPIPCRVYAPVGSHEELLPYLVRRLLENGANTSFVNQLGRDDRALEQVVADPVQILSEQSAGFRLEIPLPRDIYLPERLNARGHDLSDPRTIAGLEEAATAAMGQVWEASALVGGEDCGVAPRALFSPANHEQQIGEVREANREAVLRAMELAEGAAAEWDRAGGEHRAQCLERAAKALEEDDWTLALLVAREGGRTLEDALAEVREAVDFCRYYAAAARSDFAAARRLPGPTGETNRWSLHGRGAFACISPWNFPLAIFTGQVSAALAAGNAVLAKPARQTPLVAGQVVRRLHQAGVPPQVLHLLPGGGPEIGAPLLSHPALAGVAFTGSTETARHLQRALSAREGPLLPLIAETGGQNVMIADSSALLEQLVTDVLQSAFNSAGQRCSALRALFVQDDIADALIERLIGAMEELIVGDPLRLSTDIGPVIDRPAQEGLEAHCRRMASNARLLHQLLLPRGLASGTYFPPCLVEIPSLSMLHREVFGPILHIIRFPAGGLDQVIDAVNATGYGLTLGVHSRIEATWRRVQQRARVGNLYINRNMIGAVVGVQPFGGEGLSGTGPKAGGPLYVHRFAVERTVTVNTAAIGGNAELLSRN